MTRWLRIGYAAMAAAFLVGLVVQVFLIGLYAFNPGDASAAEAHIGLGWMLHLAPIPLLLVAYLARAGRTHWQWALALAIVVFVVPILATMRETSVVAAALHPVGAMASFVLATVVAWNSVRALRMPEPARAVEERAAA